MQGDEQMFEDYGDADNSLLLEAHGHVPYNKNSFHCATMPSKYLPSYNLLSNDVKIIISNLNTRDVIYTPVLLNFARLLNAPQRYLELCCNGTVKIYMYINFISKSKKARLTF